MKQIFILISLFFISGCSISLSYIDDAKNIVNEIENKEYQYSAPWDVDMYDRFYEQAEVIEEIGNVKGGIVPHHLLAGHMDAVFFDYIGNQNPSTIVLIGPNHFGRGHGKIVSSVQDWKTIYGYQKTNVTQIKKLVDNGIVSVEESVIADEHSIYSLIPFIRKSIPGSTVIPLALRGDLSYTEMGKLVEEIINVVPRDTVFVSSIDFSHYQNITSADFHDELSHGVIRSFDFDRIEKLEIDSIPSLYTLMRLMEHYGTQKIGHEISDNSAKMARSPGEELSTSYYSPYFVKGEPDDTRVVSILNFGDMMLDRDVAYWSAIYGDDYPLRELAGLEGRFFMGSDIVTANLEGPFADWRRETSKSIAFRFDPKLIPVLHKYNFSLFNLANNHSLDMSSAGFEESKENLAQADIDFYGEQFRVSEENSYISKNIGGMNFGFIGLNDTNTALDDADVKELIHLSEKENELTIINIHWGSEYGVLKSNTRQQELAHMMIDAGADVIIGHHPHVIQEIEIYRDRPIFYSLGNFVFDQDWSVPTQQGLGVGLVFDDIESISAYLFPLNSIKGQTTQMEYSKAKNIIDQLFASSRMEGYTMNESHNFSFTIPLN